MRAAAIAVVWIVASCAPAGGAHRADSDTQHDDPVLDRYRSENFLDAGRRARQGIEAGLRRSMPHPGADPTEDLHLRVGIRTVDAAARRRRRSEACWEAYHAAWTPHRGLEVSCGDYIPDAGIGLVSSARRFAGAMTSAWPLAGSGMRRWTGFYDSFIRGGAASFAISPFSATLFAGVPGTHGPRGTRVGGAAVGGLRAAASLGRMAVGVSLMDRDPGTGRPLAGLEGAAVTGPATATAEVSFAGGATGAAWGCALRLGRLRASALLYHVPRGSTGSLSYIPGAPQRKEAARSGTSAALRARLQGGCLLEASVGRADWRDGYSSGSGTDARLRLELRRRGWSVMMTARAGGGYESDCMPIPPEPPPVRERRRSVELSGTAVAARAVRLRGTLRLVSEDRSSGWLAAAGVRIESRRGGARIDAGGARCRSRRGRTVFRFHEPSVPGAYSWKTISGECVCCYIVCLVRFLGLCASAGLSWQDGTGAAGEAAVRLKY